MTEYNKLINYLILSIIVLICSALGVFLIINFNNIANPELVPGYVEGQATFAYGRDSYARFRNWGFYYPMSVIPYLIFFESILLALLIINKKLKFKKTQWILILMIFLFLAFSNHIIDFLIQLLNIENPWRIEYHIGNLFEIVFYLGFLFLLVVPPILFFLKKFKNYRKFLILIFTTVLTMIVFIIAHLEFFFD